MRADYNTPLRKVRKSRNLSVSELARLSGLTERTIYNIEGGIRKGTAETLNKLAAALEVSIENLLPPKSKASDDGTERDFAARLVEEELSRFPRLKAKVTPKQKQRLAEIVRKHLQNTIESMDEAV